MPDHGLKEAILHAIRRGGFKRKKDFAEAAGITETTLYNLLRGDEPSGSTLAKLQRAGVQITRKLIESLERDPAATS